MEEDKIIYSLIAFKNKPLVEYSPFTGTFNQACLRYLNQIENNTSKVIKMDDYFIFYINEQSLTFMIMTGKSYPKETALGCLQSIMREFNTSYAGRNFEYENNFGLNADFKEKLKLKFEYFNENKDVTDDKIGELRDQLNDMKEEILNASGLLDERGEKMQILGEKADTLSRDSQNYYRQAKKVTFFEKCKKIKYYIAIGIVILLIIYMIIGFTCGWGFQCARN